MSDSTQNPDDTIEAMLSELEARVLGSLMEKQMTTPDYYPLTLNALVSACNQKSSRNPVMNLSPVQVGSCVNTLRGEGLVTAMSGSRVDRFEQHLSRKLHLSSKERALIAVLLLRGAQTLNELRIHTNRMAEYESHEEIEALLTELAGRDEPLAIRLPRAAGQREERFMHLLCGMPDITAQAASSPASFPASSQAAAEPDPALAGRVAGLEQEVARLREELRQLKDSIRG